MFRKFHKPSAKIFALHACIAIAALQLAGCSSREQRAQNYYEHGMSYVEAKDYVKARIELRNALQIKPDLLTAWKALAEMDERDRNFQALAGDLRRIVEIDPKDVASKLRLGRLFLLGGAFDNALKTVNEAAELEPQNTAVMALKAAILFKLKDTDGAANIAKQINELDPGNAEGSVVLAATMLLQNDPQGALKILDQVKSDKKNDFGVMFLQLNVLDRLGDMPQVEAVLRKFVTLYPKEPAFRTQLVRFYVTQKRPDDAVKELRSVVEANPADVTAELNLASLLASLKGVAAAREELVARIAAGGSVFPFQIALAKLDFAQGNIADSKKLLESLIGGSTAPDDIATAKVTLAEMYMSKNDIAAAEPLVTDILKSDARNINGLMMRASIHLSRGQNDDAVADLRAALNDQPQSPGLLANLAVVYERSGSIELADKAFLDATKASKYAPTVGLNYIAFLRRRGLTAQAETVLADLASRNPNNIQVLTALAQAKLAHQDWAAAHAIADAIHRLGDKTDVADQINGAAFGGEKKFDESLAVLQNAYDANPGASQPMGALVAAYLQAKQLDKAEAFLESALKANPKNADALVLMGSLQMAKNDQAKAISYFQAAIEMQPKNIVGYQTLADYYARQGKIDDAVKIAQSGLEQLPKNFSLRLLVAGLHEIQRDYERAIADYEDLLKDQPGSMVVANNLASLLADHRSDKASLDQASSLSVMLQKSQVPQFKDTLGWVAYRRDDYNAAIALLEGARTELPRNPLVIYHLGMSYLATGQVEKAAEQFSKARELAPNDAELKRKLDAADAKISEKTKG